jgi:hypothetical protein
MLIHGFPYGIIKTSFGIYLGWICIATIANVTVLLVHFNWNGFGMQEPAWAIILIAAGALIASLAILRLQNPFIGLAVIWAFIGIFIKRQNDYHSIALAAIIALVIVAVITVAGFFRRNIGLL